MRELDERAQAILKILNDAVKCLDALIVYSEFSSNPVHRNPPTCLSHSGFICRYLDEDGVTEKIAILPTREKDPHDMWNDYLNNQKEFPYPLYAAAYFISITYPIYGITGLGVQFDSGLEDNHVSSIILGTPKDFV